MTASGSASDRAADERIVADSGGRDPSPGPTWLVVLQRKPGDEPVTGRGPTSAGWDRSRRDREVPREAVDPTRRICRPRVRVEVPGQSSAPVGPPIRGRHRP
jgi:hypothetical protein